MITDYSIMGATTGGSVALVIASAGQMPTSILATANAGSDAVIEVGWINTADAALWIPILAPSILPGGLSTRIRIPAMRPPQGSSFRFAVRSSQPVDWVATGVEFSTPNTATTTLRVATVRPGIRTAIFGPSTGSPRWRGVSCMFSNASAASSLVKLAVRYQLADSSLVYKDFAGPVLVPPYGSVRISPFPDVDFDLSSALYGQSETVGTFFSYGVQKP
ncbi:hypothetical protein JL37_11115 [Achromobacter sp. RTa]|uniref:hypothetical protein n=1 Tax=Achromobacter sp. RTa TaxID=1532557 RepID=UPI00050E086D|nr:hypothetical protein [Achromobacter sp. RTa]KGD95236.1 hypothetical protein JL37_11115 [Achromobacter sp. RTa]